MKTTHMVMASLATLLAAGLASAADPKPIARVIAVTEVETEDASGYATWIAKNNEAAKAKLGVEPYMRLYETVFDGKQAGRVRVVTAAASVAEMTKQAMALEGDSAIAQNRDHLRAIRKTGARVLYQAVRFDGPTKNASLYTTMAAVPDEAAYLKALDELRAIFDGNGLSDVKISAYRALAGRTDATHLVSIAAPSMERLAAFLDLAATSPRMADWLARSAKLRTVVTNFMSREITK